MTRDEKRMGYAPIWYWNCIEVFDWTFRRDEDSKDMQSYVSLLVYWSQFVNEFLDATKVLGDKNAERVVRVMNRLFSRFCRFYTLKVEETDSQVFKDLCETHRRLNGLVKGMK